MSNFELSDHDMAVRFIQDSEFVQPGDTIHLDFYQAIDTYLAGLAAGRIDEKARSAKSIKAPAPKETP